RGDFEIDAAKAGSSALAEAQRRGRIQGDADDLLEHVAVAVPADSGAGVVAGKEDVDEVFGPQPRECRRFGAHAVEPARDRLGRRKAGVLEIVSPAIGLGLAVPEPAVEAK